MAHRKTRRIYDKALTYEKLYAAWNTVSHTCKNKRGLYEFSMFQQARISKLLEDLKARDYYPNKYRCFMIFEPKPRLVMSQSIRDKVVNHFVAQEYLLPLLDVALIDTNVATRYGKGSSYVAKMLRRYFAQMMAAKPGEKIYALKIDISKYFYSIDHEILFEKLRRRIKDGDVLEILHRIIDETNQPYINKVIDGFNYYYKTTIPHYKNGKGLSIGAMTSQFLVIYNCMARGGFSFLGYRYYVAKSHNNIGGTLRVVCLSKTVKRVRRRLLVLWQHDIVKYDRSYESYRGYFMNTLPIRKMEQYVGEKLM